MKAMIKSNFKRRILPVFSSVVLLCLVVLVIIFTRTTEAAADSVTIGNRTYNEHNKMVILEIVPDERYDALGCLVADDQGVVKWKSSNGDGIVDKQPANNKINMNKVNRWDNVVSGSEEDNQIKAFESFITCSKLFVSD